MNSYLRCTLHRGHFHKAFGIILCLQLVVLRFELWSCLVGGERGRVHRVDFSSDCGRLGVVSSASVKRGATFCAGEATWHAIAAIGIWSGSAATSRSSPVKERLHSLSIKCHCTAKIVALLFSKYNRRLLGCQRTTAPRTPTSNDFPRRPHEYTVQELGVQSRLKIGADCEAAAQEQTRRGL